MATEETRDIPYDENVMVDESVPLYAANNRTKKSKRRKNGDEWTLLQEYICLHLQCFCDIGEVYLCCKMWTD